MRVAIDLLILEKEFGGMFFATHALLEGLARIDHTNEYIIITARPQEYQELAAVPNIRIQPIKLRSWRGILIRHQLLLPDVLRKLRPDVLHVPAFAAPIGWHGPLVLTVHDLAFLKMPEQASLYANLYWQYMLRESSRRAQRIIAISEKTCEELVSYWSIEKERIRLIHNALRPVFSNVEVPVQDLQVLRQRYGPRYLLHPGRIMPRKNIETLVRAFELLAPRFEDLHLVLTGGAGYGSKEVVQQIEESPYRERIHQSGWVSDQELKVLYAGASVLAFPSRHEGFGLPIVEAMTCGTPVVASPEAASMDIAGEAVLRADCSSPAPLAEAIAQILDDQELRERLIQLGRKQAQSFSIEECARATLRVYQEAIGLEQPPASSTASKALPANINADPSVSVILPVSRLELAAQALKSLARQRFAGTIETIVVGTIADELARAWPVLPVTLEALSSPGRARNLGVAHASGDILLFLDDDCIVAEDWVERNVRALQRPGVGVVGARICGKSRAFFARCVDYTNFGYYQQEYPVDGPVASASMGVWRSVFQAVGGFDEIMRTGEDMDFCYRVQKQGYRSFYQPEIVVLHDHRRSTFGQLVRYNYSHGFSGGLTTKIQHRDVGLKNRLLFLARSPWLFFFLFPLAALLATAQVTLVNLRESPRVLLSTPFIFSGKLAYEFGIFRYLLKHRQPGPLATLFISRRLKKMLRG